MQSNKTKLTILTPTYNRAELLIQLYKSLCNQTCKDFQWLIIDDGSNDNTREIVESFILENKICIDYRYKQNGGKHTAINFSHSYIKGNYLVIVDSDDYLTDNAVEVILNKWKVYYEDSDIAGITFQKGKKDGKTPFDDRITGEYISTFALEVNKGMKGDHCETVRSDLFKNFSFPEYKNENFIAEGAMWFLITQKYKIVYCNEIVYLAEYLENGLTKSGRILHIRNPQGCLWHASVFLNTNFNMKIRIKNALLYICYRKILNENKISMIDNLKEEGNLIKMIWPIGCLVYIYWKMKYRIGK